MGKPKVGVVLSGCGVYDGSEIHEAVMTIYFLDKNGAEIIFMAPNEEQYHVINHLTGNPSEGEKRNILVESARIARGKIRDIKSVSASELDALIFPGGFGAAKNLTTFAFEGADCNVNDEVNRLVKEIIAEKKPLAAICIAPVLVAKALGRINSPSVTIGFDEGTASAIESFGAKHVGCPVSEYVVDKENKIITTPAYMLGKNISEIAEGIEKCVKEMMSLI